MGLRNLLKVWASSPGNKTERTDLGIAQGWALAEPPPWNEWNFQENARDTRINENTLGVYALKTTPPAATKADICTENHITNPWHNPSVAPNYLNIGAGIRGSCFGIDNTNNTVILWVVDDANLIRPVSGMWLNYASPSLGAAFTPSYPATMSFVISICCDGAYLYVMWVRDSDGRIMVSRFASDGASSFLTSPDWTYTTPQTYYLNQGYRIIDALDGTNVALFFTLTTTPTANQSVAILSKDGTTYNAGTGNLPSTPGPASHGELWNMIADGTHVYWLIGDEAAGVRSTYLASARITDPTTSNYTYALISADTIATGYQFLPKDLVALADVINISTQSGRIYRFRKSTGQVAPVINVSPTYSEDDDNLGSSLGFDGKNLWIQAVTVEGSATPLESITFYRVPAAMCGAYAGRASLPDFNFLRIVVPATSLYPDMVRAGDFRFDGADLWWVGSDGALMRISNPGGL